MAPASSSPLRPQASQPDVCAPSAHTATAPEASPARASLGPPDESPSPPPPREAATALDLQRVEPSITACGAHAHARIDRMYRPRL